MYMSRLFCPLKTPSSYSSISRRRIHVEAPDSSLLEFLYNIKYRAQEKPGWALANQLLRGTFLYNSKIKQKKSHLPSPEVGDNPKLPNLPPPWKKDTNTWTLELAKSTGVSLENADSIQELFPTTAPIILSPQVEQALKTVPYASSPKEFIQKFNENSEYLKRDPIVSGFARKLYRWCENPQYETTVDMLLHEVLELCHLDTDPLEIIPKLRIETKFNNVHLVSIPDFVVQRRIKHLTHQIVGVAVANKAKISAPGQIIGTALAASVYNYNIFRMLKPIPIISAKGTSVSFARVEFSPEFMDCITLGNIPRDLPAKAIFLPGWSTPGLRHAEMNLLDEEGRRLAFESFAYVHNYITQIPS